MIKVSKKIYGYFIVYSIAIFGSGLFVGQRFYHPHPPFPPHGFGMGRHGGPQHDREFEKKRFFEGLALTTQQQEVVDKIMTKHRPKIEEHITAMRQALDRDKQEIDKEIELILTADQKKVFATMKQMPGPPPPPPGH